MMLVGLSIGFCIGLYVGTRPPASWQGVDETVVEKYALASGRRPLPPLINTNHGNLLLFLFLAAGVVGGFLGGYCFRETFPPKKIEKA